METGVPQYRKIYNILLKKINKGEFTKDTPIPSENELAEKYSVSRMTARKSVDMLVSEGYLERFKGRGTFITGRQKIREEEISLTRRLKEESRRVFNLVLRTEIQDITDEKILGLAGKKESLAGFWVYERQRFVNDVPVILERGFIPLEIFGRFGEEEAKRSIVEMLESAGEIGVCHMEAEPYLSESKKEAKKLSMKKNQLCLLVKTEMYFADGRLALYSESLQNTQLLPYRLQVGR